MYPQFAESQPVRGLPDVARNQARFPYHPYYASKVPEGMSYPAMARPSLNPYAGKPPHDPMYGGHLSWNSMMGPPGMMPPMQKPMMASKPEYSFPGQEQQLYRSSYHPDLMNSGAYPGYMYPAYQHPPSYLPPPPPPSMPPPQMDGYSIPPPQSNNVWDGSPAVSSANLNSPGRNWSGHQDMMGSTDTLHQLPSVPSGYQASQSPQPPPPPPQPTANELQKENSVSSLKDALSTPPAPPPPPPQQSLHEPSSNKSYQFNTPPYLGVSADSLGHTSPRTPNAAGTPDPATPVLSGIIANSEPGVVSASPLPTPQNDLGSHSNSGSRPTPHSPFEVEAILGFNKDSRTVSSVAENGDSFSLALNSKSPSAHHKSVSPTSSAGGSPSSKKTRSPVFSPVSKNHPSLSNQYSMSDEPGRKDFLDAIFKYMEQESMPFLKPPSINKTVLDLYKTFTAVQSLGGFTHVVDKRLWKDVLKSFSPSNSPSSASLRTLSEYYVSMLLPYECHFSHSSFTDCMSHYEISHRGPPNDTTAVATTDSDTTGKQPDRTKQSLDNTDLHLLDSSRDNLLFSEDSQGSLDGFSNQPLPDISVQEAESVLGISTSTAGPQPATPSPSFPPGWSSSGGGGTGEQPIGEPSLGGHYQPGVHPGGGAGYHGYYTGSMIDYSNYQRRSMMPYMSRGGYPGYQSPMDDGSYSYPNLPMAPRVDDYAQHGMGGGGDWSWSHPSMQQRPHLPPPLPPHLQSMMFTPAPAPPPLSLSPRPSTPQQQQQQQQPSSVDHLSSSSVPPLDPIKIMITDQGPPPSLDKSTPPLPQKPQEKEIKPLNKEMEKTLLHQQLTKRPSEPVESCQPQLIKRRRLNCDHCGNVEPWRVMMSLKCGLPSDSTWALDTLTILLHDDRTVGFFYLKHHHSLLNTLVNHFNACLFEIFGEPFQLLDKFEDGGGTRSASPGGSESVLPTASVYHHTATDVRMGLADHVCHLINSSPVIDVLPETIPKSHPLATASQRKRRTQRVDETKVEELLKRDALSERILLHLKTPRRLMARSPIQKYFMPPQNDEEVTELKECKDGGRSPLREEDEVFRCEPLPLSLVPSQQESLKQRTLSLSNILRSLSFIPGNDIEFSQHPGLLIILGHILLLHHVHRHSDHHSSPRLHHQQQGKAKSDKDMPPTIVEEYWWWSCLDVLRENAFVILANIGGQLDFSLYPEAITYPLITGLLHWLVCPSSVATDPLPDSAMVYSLSPQRLVVEALAKVSISEANVDYILATPPLTRLDLVYATLLQFIGQKKHPAVRQFALVLLSDLAQGSEGASRMIGQQKMTLPLLLECLESSLSIAKPRYLSSQYNDDANSLSLAMLRRAAVTLHCVAKVPVNRVSFLPYCNRVLALCMSEMLDPSLTSILSDVLYELTRLL